MTGITGRILTPGTTGILVASAGADRFARRHPQRWLIISGFLITAVGMLLLFARVREQAHRAPQPRRRSERHDGELTLVTARGRRHQADVDDVEPQAVDAFHQPGQGGPIRELGAEGRGAPADGELAVLELTAQHSARLTQKSDLVNLCLHQGHLPGLSRSSFLNDPSVP
jgi:ABC-type nickel/cobalt efflux system permease component RcnA